MNVNKPRPWINPTHVVLWQAVTGVLDRYGGLCRLISRYSGNHRITLATSSVAPARQQGSE